MKNSVLVFDPSSTRRNTIKGVFINDYNVYEGNNAEEVFCILNDFTPDIIMIAVQPGKKETHLDFIQELKKSDRYGSVIILSLIKEFCEETILHTLKSGAHDFHVYTTNKNILLHKVNNLINYKKSLSNKVLGHHFSAINETIHSEEVKKLKKFEQLIEEQIKDDIEIDINSIAKVLNLSQRTFERAVKKTYKMTPVRYIMSKRLEKSLQLLKTGQISIKDIAYQSGFNSVAYFSKCFRSFYGYSPSIVKRNQAII